MAPHLALAALQASHPAHVQAPDDVGSHSQAVRLIDLKALPQELLVEKHLARLLAQIWYTHTDMVGRFCSICLAQNIYNQTGGDLKSLKQGSLLEFIPRARGHGH